MLIELLRRLEKPEPAYFSADLKSFIFQSNNAASTFLTFPGEFVLQTVLDTHSAESRFHGGDFSQWVKIVLSAQSRDAIGFAEVELDSSLISYGLDFGKITDQHENGRLAFAKAMGSWRTESVLPTREEHALDCLRSQGIVRCDGDIEAVADAAHHYKIWLAGQDKTYDYAAEQHRGDWVDSQLLYYLADPKMHILTNDRALKARCAASKQAERIIIL